MKKNFKITLFSVLILSGLFACDDHRGSTAPILTRIAKVFTVVTAEENNVLVYTRGAANNIRPGYSKFLLDLTVLKAILRDFDGNTFVARNWVVTNDTKLTLQDLTPQPTGTNGTIEFTINSITDTELVITRTTVSEKTGGLIVKYKLSSP